MYDNGVNRDLTIKWQALYRLGPIKCKQKCPSRNFGGASRWVIRLCTYILSEELERSYCRPQHMRVARVWLSAQLYTFRWLVGLDKTSASCSGPLE
jgi:hypothetical protein